MRGSTGARVRAPVAPARERIAAAPAFLDELAQGDRRAAVQEACRLMGAVIHRHFRLDVVLPDVQHLDAEVFDQRALRPPSYGVERGLCKPQRHDRSIDKADRNG